MADNGTRSSRETIFFNVGHQGRRTGITVEDTGKRDEHGFEPMDNFFSPEKIEVPQPPPPTAPKPAPGVLRSSSAIPSSTGVNQTATDGSMAVAESSGVEPQEARALQMRQASLPPNTSRTPGKFTVSGSPIRGSSIGPRSSPTRQLDSSPIRSLSPNKKLDFGIAKRAESVSSVLGSPTRKPIAPKANGRATSVGPAVPEKQDVVRPREREMSNPPREYEPTKLVAPVAPMATNSQPVKRPQVVGKIVEEDEIMDDSAIAQSPPAQKKPTKRGLVSARPAAKPIAFDDSTDEEQDDTTKANGDITNGRDTMEEAASELLDSTLVSSRNAEVVMPDAPVGEDPQMDELPAPAPVKTKQTAKTRKALTPELQPQSKKPTKSAKMLASEPESEAETEELEPVKFQGKKRPEQKKTIPTSAPELTPEEDGDDATQDMLEPKASQKRPAAKKPHPVKKMVSANAKVAPKAEPEPEPVEEDEEDIDEDDLEPKRFSFQKRSTTKPVAAKGKKVQPRPEPGTDKVQDQPVARESKSRTAKTEPAKKVAPVPEPEPELEVEEVEQEVAASIKRPNEKSAPGKGKQRATVPEAEMEPEAEQEETKEEKDSPAKKQSKPRKKLTMKTTSRATKKNVPQPALELDAEVEEEEEAQPAPVPKKRGGKAAKKAPTPEPEGDDDEPMLEPVKPAPKRKGRGKAKVAEEEPEPEPKPVKFATTAKGKGKKVAEETEPEPELKKPATTTKSKGRGKVPNPPNPELSEPSSQPARTPSIAKVKLKDTPQDDEEPPKKKARSGGKAPKVAVPSRVSPRKRGHAPARMAVPSPEDEQAPMDVDDMEVDAPPPRKGKGKGKAPTKTAPTIASGPPIAKETRGSQRVVREKPPPAPGQQSSGMEGSRRSVRARVAPLQYWKGEKAEYALADIDQDNPRMKSMRMPQLVGVVRIESDEEQKPKRRAPAPKKKAPSAGAKRKRTLDGEGSDDDSDPGEPDVWERSGNDEEVGVKKGKVRAYPAVEDGDDEEQMEEAQLAFSKHRMITVGVANGEFKFVKTFTDEHFGTGIIEILPGGTKRFKSSGKMYLVFYILKGRVAVTIAKTNFRVGKGGQFMVPRGNLYSIENEYDTPAKMFFAQGCAPDIYEDEDVPK